MNSIKIISFPLFQFLFLVLAFYLVDTNLILSLFLVFGASVFLNFSLHISYHYHVHFKSRYKMANFLIEIAASLLMGIPFHYYQMSHLNHHKYDNKLGDFTSTWKQENGNPIAKSFFIYCFLWPLAGEIRLKKQIELAKSEGYFNRRKELKMKLEWLFIFAFIVFLFYLNVLYGFAYIMMVYTGWSMIAMHNFGQHLPEKYGELKANSYYNKLYNFLFINNGLHLEHHEKPGLKYWELNSENKGKIEHPHLVEGLYFSSKPKQEEND